MDENLPPPACLDEPKLFEATFDAREHSAEVILAKMVCSGCGRREVCLADNLDERSGVWGGTTGRERRRLKKQGKAPAVYARGQARRTA